MDGFINVNKPKDFTSQDVLNVIKRNFRGTKIGHGGTLDPGATGVLPVCLGKGTKLQDHIMGGEKTYIAEIAFGCDSPTLDMDGDYEICDKGFSLEAEDLLSILPEFIGEIGQVPPMVSAIKRKGVPLYKLARKGKSVELSPRTVTIYGIEVLAFGKRDDLPLVKLKIICSKGTYIRSLARDLGEALGTKAIVASLERVTAGDFSLAEAYTLAEIGDLAAKGDYSFILPLDYCLKNIPAVKCDDIAAVTQVLRGAATDITANIPAGSEVRLLDFADNLLALGEVTAEQKVQPRKVLYTVRQRKKPLQIIDGEFKEYPFSQDTAVALGNFDGVHLGHRYLLEHMALEAENRNLTSLALTFSPHPRDFLTGGAHKYLQTKEAKARHIGAAGVDALWFMNFDASLASMSAQEFVDNIIIKKLRAKILYVGYNFKFGRGAENNAEWLRKYCAVRGIDVRVLEKITYTGIAVSSSNIKDFLCAGDMKRVNELLGYNFSLGGTVVTGRQLGRTIGFPTANLDYSSSVLLPEPGIYITWAKYRGQGHPSVTNIGNCPTVGDNLALTVEVHILDDEPDIYGEDLEVVFLRKLRGEIKFLSLEQLKIKINEDAETARRFFAARKGR